MHSTGLAKHLDHSTVRAASDRVGEGQSPVEEGLLLVFMADCPIPVSKSLLNVALSSV